MGDDDTNVLNTYDLAGDPEKKSACFIVLSGSQAGRMYKLEGLAMIIGRGEGVPIQVEDDGTSRRHAMFIQKEDGSVMVQDLSSTNGTYCNGERIKEKSLSDGDKIQIGGVEPSPELSDQITRDLAHRPTEPGTEPLPKRQGKMLLALAVAASVIGVGGFFAFQKLGPGSDMADFDIPGSELVALDADAGEELDFGADHGAEELAVDEVEEAESEEAESEEAESEEAESEEAEPEEAIEAETELAAAAVEEERQLEPGPKPTTPKRGKKKRKSSKKKSSKSSKPTKTAPVAAAPKPKPKPEPKPRVVEKPKPEPVAVKPPPPKPEPKAAAKILAKRDIMIGIKRNTGHVTPCLSAARQRGELAPGRYTMVLSWTIQPDGSVKGGQLLGPASVMGTSMPPCFAKAMASKWKFPKSDKPTSVKRYPFGPIQVQ